LEAEHALKNVDGFGNGHGPNMAVDCGGVGYAPLDFVILDHLCGVGQGAWGLRRGQEGGKIGLARMNKKQAKIPVARIMSKK
jgi:hypothetical protein